MGILPRDQAALDLRLHHSYLSIDGSKREEGSDLRAKSDQSARRVSTGTDVLGENCFSSGILLLKGRKDVLCRTTD
jgi:hypothetical protein